MRTKADIYCPEVESPLIFLLNLFSFPSQLTSLWTKFITCLKPPIAPEIKGVKGIVKGPSWQCISPIPTCIPQDRVEVLKGQGLGPLQPSLHCCFSEAAVGNLHPRSEIITCGLEEESWD